MAGEGIFQSKKNVIIALRFLMLASLLAIAQFQKVENLQTWHIVVALVVLAGSNVWLIAMPRHRFKSQMLYGSIFITDLVVVTLLMIAVAGNKIEFYAVFIPYIAAILYTAWKRKLSSAFLAVLIAGIFYALLIITSGEASELLSTPFLAWIILFFLTAFFVGYLAEEVGREIKMQEKLEATEKKTVEITRELGKLQSLHELITESIPTGLIVFDENLVIEYANPQFASMLEVPDKEIIGTPIGDIPCKHEAGQKQLQNLFAKAIGTGVASGPDEFKCKNPEGQDVDIACNIYPLALDDKLRMVALIDDVTEKKDAEVECLEKMRVESQFKILASLSGAMSSLGSFRQIVSRFASATEPILSFTACATLDLDKKPLAIDLHLTTTVGKRLVKQLRDRMSLSMAQLVPESPVSGEIAVEFDRQMLSDDQEEGMESFLAVPVVVDSRTVALIGFASTTPNAFKPQDITFAYTLANYYSLLLSRARMEEEMLRREVDEKLHRERLKLETQRKETEIEATRKSLEVERKSVQELKRIDELKSEFITTVSHEMRTPMTSIKSSMDLLLSGRLGDIQKEHKPFLEIAVRNINRLAQLIDDVLNVSRIESGQVKMAPGVYELKPVLENVVSTLETKLKESSGTVEDRIPGELKAYFDRNCLTQVFTNLIANAVNHNEPGIRVTISVLPEQEGFITVSVADNGGGIPEKEHEKIFKRFYQSGRTYGEGSKGTGLGLTISRGLVKNMGGKMWLKSGASKGADFRFTLPLTSEILVKPEEKPSVSSESELNSALLFGKIARLMKFATQEQIDECASEQGARRSARRLGELLIEKGYITPEQREIILQVQETNLARPSPQNPDKTLADTILGRLAVNKGLLKEEQVNECLREQALLESDGKPVLLGELLVQKGYVSVTQILDILEEQKSGAGPEPSEDEKKQDMEQTTDNSEAGGTS
jgi:PAS domain S-box-containing protein